MLGFLAMSETDFTFQGAAVNRGLSALRVPGDLHSAAQHMKTELFIRVVNHAKLVA